MPARWTSFVARGGRDCHRSEKRSREIGQGPDGVREPRAACANLGGQLPFVPPRGRSLRKGAPVLGAGCFFLEPVDSGNSIMFSLYYCHDEIC